MRTEIKSSRKRRTIGGLAALGAALALTACGSSNNTNAGSSTSSGSAVSTLPTGGEPVHLDPADFTTAITNPYWPMSPGSRWVYSETDGEGGKQRVVVTVTDQTKQIADGVEAQVVHDVVSAGGEPVEVTDDYYAQDRDGNIWYLGESTAEYEDGKVSSRHGSFEAGVAGAQPGIAVPGDPQPGLSYRQEYKAGEAEDSGKVLSVDATAEVPFGSFDGVLKTEDTNPLDHPQQIENKFYAEDVGPVMTLDVTNGGREELLSYEPGA
jgi:hypothetical protein